MPREASEGMTGNKSNDVGAALDSIQRGTRTVGGSKVHRPPIDVGYILQSYPSLTMTFIYREIMALESRGFSIATFSVWRPNKSQVSQESWRLMDSTYYVFPVSWPRLLLAHLYFLASRPFRYCETALFVLTRKGETWKNRVRTLGHFGQAVYLAREVQRRRIKHVHAHFVHNAASFALIISRLLGISFSFTAHNILFIDQILLREKIREAKFVAAISEFTRSFLVNWTPGEEHGHKIHVVHCGVSPADFAPPDPRPDSDVPVLLFVGQLEERKGAPVLVQACKLLVERNVPFQCVLVGSGPQRELVEQLVDQHGLRHAVSLAGVVLQEHLREYLDRASVFVMPCVRARSGDMDGIPVVLMEAMAMEIPVVSTWLSGIPELVKHEQSGLLVEPQDARSLADAIQRLLEDQELCARLGKNGRTQVLQEFDIRKCAEQLAMLFGKYVGVEG